MKKKNSNERMRDALKYIARICGEHINLRSDDDPMNLAYEKAISALKYPLRNCDIGTAAEQTRQFEIFCETKRDKKGGGCTGCPLLESQAGCEFAWGQMPCEEKKK